MLISYNWIQRYFDKPLPEPDDLAALLCLHSFEIEGVENKTTADGEYEDTILDVKVLADRAPFCLSHRYMAEEIGALIRQEVKWPEIAEIEEGETSWPLKISFSAEVSEKNLCYRKINRVVENVYIQDSPAWLRHQLEVLGQRSVNSIVDLTNYVMLETGEPTHAFDADKVRGNISVRTMNESDELILLDGTKVANGPDILVIADEVGPLDIAGIKGGKRAEITRETKNVILEAACFNRTNIRRTSQALGIRTESSKRFENGVTPERAGLAMAMLTAHVLRLNPDAVVGEVVDVYPNRKPPVVIEVSIEDIHERLAVEVPQDRMIDILTRLNIEVEEGPDTLKLGIPEYRPDLRITEDIIEEVGRVYGYDKVPERVPEAASERHPNKNFYYFNIIRKFLAERGFSEVYTYSLIEKGDMAIVNPLTVERSHMRNSITDLMPSKILFNMRNIEMLGLKEIKMFELGKIFSGKKERNVLAFGIARPKKQKGIDPKAELIGIAESILTTLGVKDAAVVADRITWAEVKGDAQTNCEGMVAEIEIEEIINSLPHPKEDIDLGALVTSTSDSRRFTPISQYPFSARDIAVFVPGDAGENNENGGNTEDGKENGKTAVLDAIKSALDEEQQKLLVSTTLFDVFTKQAKSEGEQTRTSYAYRLIFQAEDRTLAQEEVDDAMKAITEKMSEMEGWEVR